MAAKISNQTKQIESSEPPPPPPELAGGFSTTLTDAGVDWLVPELLHVNVYVSVSGEATTTGSAMAALPLVARVVPAQPSSVPPPLATQVLALAEVHVSVVELPDAIAVGDAISDKVRAGQDTTTETWLDPDSGPATHVNP